MEVKSTNESNKFLNKVDKETVLLFDMNGTLVNTDLANFLSYKNAIKLVVKEFDKELHYNPNKRFNRTILKTFAPSLIEDEYQKIIKEKCYKKYLPRTKINKKLAYVLIKFSKTNRTVLVTNCRKDRTLMTLNYYNLTNKFSDLLFRQSFENKTRINKYKNAISYLNLSTQTVIVFENEKEEIQDAISAGISTNNILSL